MTVFASQIVASSASFQANQAAMLEAIRVVEEATMQAAGGGGTAARERHVSRGKMLPRLT